MSFLLPLGLLSLLALPLVLVLHLVRQRRRRMRVPSLELWAAVPAPVQRKPRRLPLTLLLLLHLLVAALLGVSLGRPLFQGGTFQPTSTVIILDTSTSMATADAGLSGDMTRFAEAQTAAEQIFSAARTGDRIGLVVLGPTPRLAGRGGPEAAASLSKTVSELTPGGPDGDLQAALNLARAAAEPDDGRALPSRYVVLTDPAFGARAQTTGAPTVTGELQWRTFGDAADNVAIVAFAARPSRQGGQQLYARVANLGAHPIARTVQLFLDGASVQRAPMRLQPGAEAEWSWPVPAGARIAEAQLTTGDAAPIDDSARIVLTGGLTRRVQLVSAAPTALERALRAQPRVELTLATPESYRPDPGANLIIFAGFVPKALPNAPTLIVAPPADSSLLKITGVKRDLRPDAAPDQRFSMIDFTAIRIARVQAVEPPAWAGVLLAAGDTPLILNGIFEGQPRTIWTFDPAESNLQGRLAFPLLTAATLDTLLQRTGNDIEVGQQAPRPMITPAGTRISTGTVLASPGIYRWAEQDGPVAVNALDADESDLRARQRPTISTEGARSGTVEREAGHELWRGLLASAIGLVMLEWLYVHRRDLPGRRSRPAAGVGRPA